MKENNEIRTREITFDLQQEGHISGRAICFNEISNVLYDPETKRSFREVILPEAVTQELIDNSDIKLLYNHDRNQMLARNNKGRGSLKVELREDGVYFSFATPNTTLGRDTEEMIKRDDLCGCSFAFCDTGATWDFTERDMPLRVVHNITKLADLSIVVNPAYDQTSVTARSIEEAEQALKPVETEADNQSSDEKREAAINTIESTTENSSYIDDLQHYKEILNTL